MPRWPRRPYRIFVWLDTEAKPPRWRWECGLCKPPVEGATRDLAKTLRNIARHCHRTRCYHHRHVLETRGWGALPPETPRPPHP